ncbi:MAG TPA: hypothetical protein VIS74_06865 [Chthoniobacterales bacterium]
MAADAQEIAKLIHDKIAQNEAAATLTAGMLAIELERESHPRAAEAKQVSDILSQFSRDLSDLIKKLRET